MMRKRNRFEELGKKVDTARENLENRTKRVTWRTCNGIQVVLETVKNRCIATSTEVEVYEGEVEES